MQIKIIQICDENSRLHRVRAKEVIKPLENKEEISAMIANHLSQPDTRLKRLVSILLWVYCMCYQIMVKNTNNGCDSTNSLYLHILVLKFGYQI